jgi:hypothetical protein
METAALRLLSADSLRFEQAEPIAGKGGGNLHHAGTGGCPDERHDAEVIHVLGNVCLLRGARVETGSYLDITCDEDGEETREIRQIR